MIDLYNLVLSSSPKGEIFPGGLYHQLLAVQMKKERIRSCFLDYHYDAATDKATFVVSIVTPRWKNQPVDAGLVAISGQNFNPDTDELTTDNAAFVKTVHTDQTTGAIKYTWNKTKAKSTGPWYARPYMSYTRDGKLNKYYGDVLAKVDANNR